jgi:hypothetical protein
MAPPAFVDAGGNHHQLRISEILVISVDEGGLGTKRGAVTQVGRNRLGAFARSVHDHNRPGTAAYNGGERASTSTPSRPDDSNFHVKSAIAKLLIDVHVK